MNTLLQNQRIRRRFRRPEIKRNYRFNAGSDIRAIPLLKFAGRPSRKPLLHTLFFSGKPLLINAAGLILLLAVFLVLSGGIGKNSSPPASPAGISAALVQPAEPESPENPE